MSEITVISSAEDLQAATEFWKGKRDEMSKGDLLAEWVQKFSKQTEKTIKEAVKQGLYSCSVYLPYQPEKDREAWNHSLKIEGKDLRNWVKERLPGCTIEYVLEPMEGVTGGYFVLEICWN
jgi:hypothetical protein